MRGVDMDAIYRYRPQPGTIPHRVLALLRSLPADTWLSKAEISEHIGQAPDAWSTAGLAKAKFAGLIQSRKDPDSFRHLFALGDGQPAPPPPVADDEEDSDLPAEKRKPVKASAKALQHVSPWAAGAAASAAEAPGGGALATLSARGVEVTASEDAVRIATVTGAIGLTRRQAEFLAVALAMLGVMVEATA